MVNGADILELPQGIALGIEHGKVVMLFYRPTDRHEWTPPDAAQFGRHMIDAAVSCGYEVVLQVPKRKITKEQRNRMVTRATLVFKNLTERGKHPSYIAKQVVDSIISMVD